MKKTKVVVCITTFNRVDCARINMEIIKYNYPSHWPIVHACSDINYNQYLEDILVRCEPKPLQAGAFDLLKSSINAAEKEFSPDFIVHLEADTWLMNQTIIEKYIQALEREDEAIIASSRWSFDKSTKWQDSRKVSKRILYWLSKVTKKMGLDWHIGWKNTMATQFFIAKNTTSFLSLLNSIDQPPANSYLEKFLHSKIKNSFGKKSFIIMQEREPVHPNYRDCCEDLELYSQHFPTCIENTAIENGNQHPGKKEILNKYSLMNRGVFMNKLLTSSDTEYYNPGAKRD